MLSPSVPITSQDHKARRGCAFAESEEKAGSQQAWCIEWSSLAHLTNTPEHTATTSVCLVFQGKGSSLHGNSNNSGDAKSSDEVGRDELRCHLTKVEEADSPREIIPGDTDILLHAKNSGIIDSLLVENYESTTGQYQSFHTSRAKKPTLEEEDGEHNRQDRPVDFLKNSLLFLMVN
jgi:hypothetical protein